MAGLEGGLNGHTCKYISYKRVNLREPLLRERLLAEAAGTFFLVFTVGMSVAGGSPNAATAIGLVLGISIYTFASVSGGMLNPAVTLAVYLSGRYKIGAQEALGYVISQCIGGFVGAMCSFAVTEQSFFFSCEETHSFKASIILESCFTMLLCSIVLSAGTSNDAPNHYYGFAIGMAVTGGATASGGFDQGSFNPAVTIGINLVNYINENTDTNPTAGSWWVFTLAPLAGGALAALIFRGTRGNEFEPCVRGEVEVQWEEAPVVEEAPVLEAEVHQLETV